MMRIRHAAVIVLLAIGGAAVAQDRPASVTGRTITGRVLSAETGQPIVGARINSNYADVGMSAVTDAQGRYELIVAPFAARYVVRASAPGYAATAYGEDPGLGPTVIAVTPSLGAGGVDFSLLRGGTIAGRVVDDAKEPIVKASVSAHSERWSFGERRFTAATRVETDDRGEFRLIGLPAGEYVVSVQDRVAVTYAPSMATLKGARRFSVGAGQTIEGVAIQTRGGASGSVVGQVTGGASRVDLVPESPEVTLVSRGVELRSAQFRLDDVAPGRYWLFVRPSPAAASPRSWVRETVVVTPGAETPGALTLAEGATIAGHVKAAARPVRELSLVPFDSTRNPEASPGRIVVASDGSFRAVGLAPGRYRWVRPQSLGSQLLAIYEGESALDLADLPLTISVGDASRTLRVEVTGEALITGTITDRDGKPTTAGGVIVAATDSRYWTGVSRRVRVVRTDQNGVFEASALPPGEYFLAYVAQLAQGQQWDSAFLKKTLAGARRVTADAGASQSVDFRLK